MGIDEKSGFERRGLILNAAIGVFGHFGYKKTTMDDLAKAADISKQGLYLRFKSKDEIFRASFKKYLDDALNSVEQALTSPDAALSDKLLSAMNEWFGRHLITFRPESFDVIQAGDMLAGDSVEEYKNLFQAKLSKAISSSTEFKKLVQPPIPKEVAHVLFLCGMSWKDGGKTRSQFLKEMAVCIRVICHIKK